MAMPTQKPQPTVLREKITGFPALFFFYHLAVGKKLAGPRRIGYAAPYDCYGNISCLPPACQVIRVREEVVRRPLLKRRNLIRNIYVWRPANAFENFTDQKD